MNLTVFTTVLGETDPLRRPTMVNGHARYVCFADRPIACSPYLYVPFDPGPEGPLLASRRLKILADHPALGHPDLVLWHDAAFQMRCDPFAVAQRHLDGCDLLAFRHPHRDRIEQEAVELAKAGILPAETLNAQVQSYREAGFINQQTITSTGFSVRRCTPAVAAFNALWWAEVERWGWRDQMSVDYALWRTGLSTRYLPGHYRDNPYAKWHFFQAASVRPRRPATVLQPARRTPVAPTPVPVSVARARGIMRRGPL